MNEVNASELLDAVVEETVASFRRSYPELAISSQKVRESLCRRVAQGDASVAELPSLHLGDLVLASLACAGDTGAIAAVNRSLQAACARALPRVARDHVDEIVQRVATRMFSPLDGKAARIEQYRGRASLVRWFYVIAVREHQALVSALGPLVDRVEEIGELPGLMLNADIAMLQGELQDEFKEAFQSSFAGLSLHERLVMRQHFRDGIPIAAMATLRAVHRNTMARELAQTRAKLFNGVMGALSIKLGVDASELREMLTPMDYKVSLSRLFAALPDMD